MTYFTADMHLGHENIISLCNRPFKNAEEMSETLVENWNNRVTDNDEVWILGDLAYKSAQNVEEYLKKLRGKKHLVLGNHDRGWAKKVNLSEYFVSVEQMGFVALNNVSIILCHYPILEWNGYWRNYYHVYGHIHNSINEPVWSVILSNDYMLNAGVEVNNYQPVIFEELIENNAKFKFENMPKKE